MMELRNKKIDKTEFMDSRDEVLAQWPTGARVDLDDAVLFHKGRDRGRREGTEGILSGVRNAYSYRRRGTSAGVDRKRCSCNQRTGGQQGLFAGNPTPEARKLFENPV